MQKPDSAPFTSVRERNAEAKNQAILDAALTLFSARGFHGVAVPEVAKLANVGAGTIYRYFENKEALVNGVYQHAKTLLATYLFDGFDFTQTPRAQFHSFWSRLRQFAEDKPTHFRFLELQDHAPYLDVVSQNLEKQTLSPILTFCTQARAKKIARDIPPEALMALIWGAFVGMIKAQDAGYYRLSESTFKAAESACWDMFHCPSA